jgi:hypothetical protein
VKPRIEKLAVRPMGRCPHADRAFSDLIGGPIALILDRLLIDDLDRRRRFA